MLDKVGASRPNHVPPDCVVDFDLYAPPKLEEGFHIAWETLQGDDVPGIVWTARNGGHWIATRGRIIRDILNDSAQFSSRVVLVPKASGEQYKMMPLTLDPPIHRSYRNLLNNSLSPRAVKRMEPQIRRLAAELTEAVRPSGGCNFTTAYAEVFPIRLFTSMIDVPTNEATAVRRLIDQINRPDGSMTFADAIRGFHEYLAPIIDQRRGGSGVDLLSEIINGSVDGRPVNREEALELGSAILMAGLDTVTNFLSFVLLSLASSVEQRRQLAMNTGLIPDAVDEYIRRFPIVIMAREVVSDVEFEGRSLKRGDMIVLGSPLHGLDQQENKCPHEIDFNRSAREHSTFGGGPHRCAGAQLARTELRIALEEWLARIPDFGIAPQMELEYRAGTIGSIKSLCLKWEVASTRSLPVPGV